jgi:hypothetical protein
MKANLFILSMTLSIFTFGQKVTKELMKIQSSEKNSKTITFFKQSTKSQNNFILKAKNESSSEYTNCKWEVQLGDNKMRQLNEALSQVNFDEKNNISFKDFSVKVKKDRVKIVFYNSSCSSEHNTHYFQKSCNRELSFMLLPSQINSMNQIFDEIFNTTIAEK